MKQQKSEQQWLAAEPAVAYNTTYLQGLKNRLIMSIDQSTDTEVLEQCLGLLHIDTMPCQWTDEEFTEVLRQSEASGNASHEEISTYFEEYGLAWNH